MPYFGYIKKGKSELGLKSTISICGGENLLVEKKKETIKWRGCSVLRRLGMQKVHSLIGKNVEITRN